MSQSHKNHFWQNGCFVTDDLRSEYRSEDAMVRGLMREFSEQLTGNQMTLLEKVLRRAYWAGRRDEDVQQVPAVRDITERMLEAHKDARALAKLTQSARVVIQECETVAYKRGDEYGLCDAIDNADHPYPSQWKEDIRKELEAVRGIEKKYLEAK